MDFISHISPTQTKSPDIQATVKTPSIQSSNIGVFGSKQVTQPEVVDRLINGLTYRVGVTIKLSDYQVLKVPPKQLADTLQKNLTWEEFFDTKTLYLNEYKVSSTILKALIKSSLQIQALDLSRCFQLADTDLTYLRHFTSLTSLDLSKCTNITDQGLQYLKEMPWLTELTLTLPHIHITGKGIEELKQSIPRLKIKKALDIFTKERQSTDSGSWDFDKKSKQYIIVPKQITYAMGQLKIVDQ